MNLEPGTYSHNWHETQANLDRLIDLRHCLRGDTPPMPTQACAVDSTKLFPNQKTSGTTKPFCVCGWRRRSLTTGLRATLFVSVVALAGELLLIYYWPIRQVQL